MQIFARQQIESEIGTNPFLFGFIGATDGHNALKRSGTRSSGRRQPNSSLALRRQGDFCFSLSRRFAEAAARGRTSVHRRSARDLKYSKPEGAGRQATAPALSNGASVDDDCSLFFGQKALYALSLTCLYL